MAADRWWQRDVECPYYLAETKNVIECEGIMRGSTIRSKFRSLKNKAEHAEDFCAGNFYGCPLYQLLEEENERRYKEGSLWEKD